MAGDIGRAFRLLWRATNPIAMALIFNALAGYHTAELRKKMIWRGSVAAFFLVLVFIFWGAAVLNFLGINMAAIEFVSGFALAFVALGTLRSKDDIEKVSRQNFSIIPLAMPILGSPIALTRAMDLFANASSIAQKFSIIAAWTCVISLACVLLLLFSRLIQVAGEVATNLLFRLGGLLALALGMQYVFSGIIQSLPAGFFQRCTSG
ncbi:MAG: MarC family protein [Puniceicoccales bacterium]|jgi:multiple antibiotic resistance protein|nr:MarC family protein [Puniceicoccales bacterium]